MKLSLICCTFSLALLTVFSGSDGHVLPVAGWSLGGAVAAQVLVDAGHLLAGHNVGYVQGRVAAVGLGAPHVHRL